jgi:hypothetical protein
MKKTIRFPVLVSVFAAALDGATSKGFPQEEAPRVLKTE